MHQRKLPASYDPNHLLNTIMQRLGLNSDGALSVRLKMARNVIKSIREGRAPVAASLLILMQETTGISIAELRFLMGDRRARLRVCYAIAN